MPDNLKSCHYLLQAMPDATLVTDDQGIISLVNRQLGLLFGYEEQEMLGQPVTFLVPESNRNKHPGHVRQYLQQPGRRMMGSALELSGQHKDGRLIPVDIMLSPIEVEGRQWIICTIRDMSEAKQIQNALSEALNREKQLARSDMLTGCANRRAFYELAEYEIERAHRYQRPFAVAYTDLDNFKHINDALGHHTGDRLLQKVGACLQKGLRSSDTVARLGGDEFALLLPETDLNLATSLVARLRQRLLNEMQTHRWPVTFSIGVLACEASPQDVDHLIRMADELMYGIKQKGKNAMDCRLFSHGQELAPPSI
ncbi:GGDEF domain-containing protein [Bowmanella dokdonensis]|uniref:GGDEF domain-containing protein n=1 Tax=Bowmanella dokdonensis TaxID=751969 RepID=A0A939ISH2_9ALTE|nr:sensor domain-containing diguanylate cyclase [Bowmanella dokdonensis]MBN7827189.1 GGDEF domain-containing protein [Bowmanella dokdonensis]